MTGVTGSLGNFYSRPPETLHSYEKFPREPVIPGIPVTTRQALRSGLTLWRTIGYYYLHEVVRPTGGPQADRQVRR